MNRRCYTLATWLMWLTLPLTALTYLRVWGRLPRRMAVHFDANWQPDGYTSREGALLLALGIVAFMLVLFTVASYAVRTNKPNSAWPLMVVFYVTLTTLYLVNNWIAQRNLAAHSSRSVPCTTIPHGGQSAKLIALQLHS